MGKKFKSISFSGCGLHVFFQVGVAQALLEHNIQFETVCACSGGVCSGLYYLLDLREHCTLDELLSIIPEGCERGPGFCCSGSKNCSVDGKSTGVGLARERMLAWLEKLLNKVPDAYKRVSNRLRITLMEWPSCHTRVATRWRSNADLLQCVRATTDIPLIDASCRPTCWRGRYYYDGGILCSHPIIDADTVCVTTCAFSQPWTDAWKEKDGWWGEISHHVSTGSIQVMRRCFYKRLWHLGRQTAKKWINKSKRK